MKILIVDDESESRETLRQVIAHCDSILRYEIPEITMAMNMKEAIAHATEISPDVILLDLNLPDSSISDSMDKIPFLSRIAPVIVITKMQDEEVALRCLSQGAKDFCEKLSVLEKKEILGHAVLLAAEHHKKLKNDQANELMQMFGDVRDKLDRLK